MPEQPGDVDRTCADITKARTLFGYGVNIFFNNFSIYILLINLLTQYAYRS